MSVERTFQVGDQVFLIGMSIGLFEDRWLGRGVVAKVLKNGNVKLEGNPQQYDARTGAATGDTWHRKPGIYHADDPYALRVLRTTERLRMIDAAMDVLGVLRQHRALLADLDDNSALSSGVACLEAAAEAMQRLVAAKQGKEA